MSCHPLDHDRVGRAANTAAASRGIVGKAKVTVGVAVYNGAATLRRAVESILHQTAGPCAIHISDDASSDNSADVAQTLANEYDSVTLTRQTSNLGPTGNFRFLLERANTEYFMWLAADDYLKPTYIERTMACLDADPTLVACVSHVCFVKPDGTTRLARGTYPLLADPETNLAVYFSDPSDNSRFYSLYRTEPLRAVFPHSHCHAFDWAAVAGTLRYGKHCQTPEVLMIRDETPAQNYIKAIPIDNRSAAARIFPLAPMTRDLIFRQKIPLGMRVLKALLYINVEKHTEYMAAFHPQYMKATKLIWYIWSRYIGWRLKTGQNAASVTVSI